jgi:hypothetical protein
VTDDLSRFGSISEQAAALVSLELQLEMHPVAKTSSTKPYATLVGILTAASTLVALFDLTLFAAGGR